MCVKLLLTVAGTTKISAVSSIVVVYCHIISTVYSIRNKYKEWFGKYK